jgi:hypothetical protein
MIRYPRRPLVSIEFGREKKLHVQIEEAPRGASISLVIERAQGPLINLDFPAVCLDDVLEALSRARAEIVNRYGAGSTQRTDARPQRPPRTSEVAS